MPITSLAVCFILTPANPRDILFWQVNTRDRWRGQSASGARPAS